MTREEFLAVLGDTEYIDRMAIATHDTEQRAAIDQAHKTNEYLASQIRLWEKICGEKQAEIDRLQQVNESWRNISQEEMCYTMMEVEALGIDFKKSVVDDGNALWDVCIERIKELRETEQQNSRLREALQALMDVQNGHPLEKYRAAWERAMSKAESILKETT